MPKYKLNINLNEEDLKLAGKAHQKVVLVKHTAGDSDSSVAWVSFKPWQQSAIDWENSFAIYSSNTEVQSKATINKLSDNMAISGVQYDFTNSTFKDPKIADTYLIPNTYCVNNNDDSQLNATVIPVSDVCGSNELEKFSLMTDSGEVLTTVDIPKEVIENAERFSIVYDNEKKVYYLQVE